MRGRISSSTLRRNSRFKLVRSAFNALGRALQIESLEMRWLLCAASPDPDCVPAEVLDRAAYVASRVEYAHTHPKDSHEYVATLKYLNQLATQHGAALSETDYRDVINAISDAIEQHRPVIERRLSDNVAQNIDVVVDAIAASMSSLAVPAVFKDIGQEVWKGMRAISRTGYDETARAEGEAGVLNALQQDLHFPRKRR
jgi:2-keto-4-pentenoate hydratase